MAAARHVPGRRRGEGRLRRGQLARRRPRAVRLEGRRRAALVDGGRRLSRGPGSADAVALPWARGARSSAGELSPYKRAVAGSIPAAPTLASAPERRRRSHQAWATRSPRAPSRCVRRSGRDVRDRRVTMPARDGGSGQRATLQVPGARGSARHAEPSGRYDRAGCADRGGEGRVGPVPPVSRRRVRSPVMASTRHGTAHRPGQQEHGPTTGTMMPIVHRIDDLQQQAQDEQDESEDDHVGPPSARDRRARARRRCSRGGASNLGGVVITPTEYALRQAAESRPTRRRRAGRAGFGNAGRRNSGALNGFHVALRLGQAVGDRPDRRRVVAEAQVAGHDGDVLAALARGVQAGLPVHDPVEVRVDRGGRHRQRLGVVLERERPVLDVQVREPVEHPAGPALATAARCGTGCPA